MRELEVRLHGDVAGRLEQTDAGRLRFAYAAEWLAGSGAPPLSLSLPLGHEVFDHRATEPFFGGLLPEEGVRDRVARFLGVTSRNDFALLAEIGGECAGAVTLRSPEGGPNGDPGGEAARPNARSSPPDEHERGPRILEDDELSAILSELPRRPLLMAAREARLSLAGAQDKIAVTVLGSGEIALPRNDEPTTHILKAPIPGFAATVANELVCLDAAKRLGLDVASAQRRTASGSEFLLVERYDRIERDGLPVRLHQEDVCAALGVPTRMKYQSEGGPSLPDVFDLATRTITRPAIARLALLRATIFNVLVGNADAHAKNFSVLHGNERYGQPGVRLAPLYDVLSTLAYEDLSPRYAMKIGRGREFAEIEARHWEQFAGDCGLAFPQVRREILAMCDALPGALDAAIRDAESPVVANAQQPAVTELDADTCRVLRFVADETRDRVNVTKSRFKARS